MLRHAPAHEQQREALSAKRTAHSARTLRAVRSTLHAMGVALLLALCALVPVWAGNASTDDPLPILRIQLPAKRLAAELDKVQQGILLQLPLPEFEAQVKLAKAALRARPPVPQLLKASYTARLQETALVGGGEWLFDSPGSAAVFPVTDLSLALRKVTLDAGSAVLGELDGKSLGLLLERSGKQTVTLDWSLRGEVHREGLSFDFHVPKCAVSTLDLNLPLHYVPTAQESAFVSGPHEAGENDRQLWRISFSGCAHLELSIERPEAKSQLLPLRLSRLVTTQQLTAEHVLARYDFEVEAVRRSLPELVFDFDALLQPYEVTSPDLDIISWELKQPVPPEKRGSLVVQLRKPLIGATKKIRILCQAPLLRDKKSSVWTSPEVQLRNVDLQTEKLHLVIHPDVRLENWQTGSFRLLKSESVDNAAALLLTDSDGGPAPRKRPSATIRTLGADWHAQQQMWWQITPQGSLLHCQIHFNIARGSLFQVPLQLPKDARIEQVRFEPADGLRSWYSVNQPKGPLLILDLQRPLTHTRAGKLSLQLRSVPGPLAPPSGATLTFPDVAPTDKCHRSGTLAISIDPQLQSTAVKTSLPTLTVTEDGPWGQDRPNYTYALRNSPISGNLTVVPRPSHVQAFCRTQVTFAAGRAGLVAHLTLEPVVGTPDAVDIQVSTPLPDGWSWRSESEPNAIQQVQRLAGVDAASFGSLVAQPNVFRLAHFAASSSHGERWRLLLTKPLTQRQVFILELPRLQPIDETENRWHIPLITVVAADRMEGEVSLHTTELEFFGFESRQLAVSGREGFSKDAAAHVFRYENVTPPWRAPRLQFRSRPGQPASATRARCDHARLTTSISQEGRQRHHFLFAVSHWRHASLKVVLPAAGQLLGARMGGRWLTHVTQQPTDEGIQLELPVDQTREQNHYELIYSSARAESTWLPWSRLEAPVPRLPLEPLRFRRTWRLPEGIVPISQSLQRLPDPVGGTDNEPWWKATERIWHSGQTLLTLLGQHATGADWETRQRQLLESAEAAVRKQLRGGKEWSFGEALEKLTFEHLKQEVPVVLDRVALHESQLRLTTPVVFVKKSGTPADQLPFWENLGLVHLPCRSAALLTTRRQLERWRSGDSSFVVSDAISEAVSEAVLHGYDRSGRFVSATFWLDQAREPSGHLPPDAAGQLIVAGLEDLAGEWTEWESPGGNAAESAIVVVRHDPVKYLGLTLAGVISVLAWRLRRRLSAAWRLRLLLLWLAVSGVLLFWLPPMVRTAVWWPAGVGLLVALWWYLRSATAFAQAHAALSQSSRPESRSRLQAAVTVGFLLLVVWPAFLSPAYSGAPGPWTVYILPGPDGAPEKQTVLLTPDTWKRLQEIAQPKTTAQGSAVLTSVSYQATVTGDVADVRAEFQAYSLADKSTVEIPLSRVQLKEGALVDGAPALPYATPTGYSVRLKERGFHSVTLRFQVRLTRADDQTIMQCGIPKLAQSKLTLVVPQKVDWLRVNSFGQQEVQAGSTTRVHAELGRTADLLVRYRVASRPPEQPTMQVRESFFWDLRAPHSLTAVWQYTISRGTLSSFSLALPEGIDPRQVEVTRMGTGDTPRVRDWTFSGAANKRQLKIELDQPAAGNVQLTIAFVPRLGTAAPVVRLALPTPLGVQTIEGALAYRVEGLETSDKALDLGIISMSAELFRKKWPIAENQDTITATRAYSYLRSSPGGRLEVALQPPRAQVEQLVQWTVHRTFADLDTTLKFTAAEPTVLLEWEVPASVTIAQLSGANVAYWSRTGSRIQIWLVQPRKKTTVSLSGWLKLPVKSADGGSFQLPHVRHPSAKTAATTLRVTATAGLTLRAQRTENLKPQLPRGPEQSLTYQTDQPFYAAEFVYRVLPVEPDVTVLTALELTSGTASLVSYLRFQVPHGELKDVSIRLRNWEGELVQLDVPAGAKLREQRPSRSERIWHLTLPPGVTRSYAVRLVSKLPRSKSMIIPEIDVAQARSRQRWVAILGNGLDAEKIAGVTTLPAPEAARLLSAYRDVERMAGQARVWVITRDDWQVTVTPRPAPSLPSVQMLEGQQEAALLDGRQWTHQARFVLLVKEAAEIAIELPRGARLQNVTLDGAIRPGSPHATEHIRVFLAASDVMQVLRVSWSYDPSHESLEQPLLDAPRLKDVSQTALLRTIHVPLGYELRAAEPDNNPVRAGPVLAQLYRADAQLQWSRHLVERAKTTQEERVHTLYVAAQKEFYWHCRQAEYLLAGLTEPATDKGPSGQSATDWLRDLHRQNLTLARESGLEKSRVLAEKQPQRPEPSTAEMLWRLPPRGTPVYWQDKQTEEKMHMHLTPVATQRWWTALLSTELLLIVLLAILLVSHFPRIVTWCHRLAPEQLLVIAVLGWLSLDLSLVGIFFILVAVSARLILFATWLQGRLQQPTPGSTAAMANHVST